MIKFFETAEKNKYQKCYNCKAMVELERGCNHMWAIPPPLNAAPPVLKLTRLSIPGPAIAERSSATCVGASGRRVAVRGSTSPMRPKECMWCRQGTLEDLLRSRLLTARNVATAGNKSVRTKKWPADWQGKKWPADWQGIWAALPPTLRASIASSPQPCRLTRLPQ